MDSAVFSLCPPWVREGPGSFPRPPSIALPPPPLASTVETPATISTCTGSLLSTWQLVQYFFPQAGGEPCPSFCGLVFTSCRAGPSPPGSSEVFNKGGEMMWPLFWCPRQPLAQAASHGHVRTALPRVPLPLSTSTH